jgi:hypothetical protein
MIIKYKTKVIKTKTTIKGRCNLYFDIFLIHITDYEIDLQFATVPTQLSQW